MSYTIDKKTGDVVFGGHQNGIADDPYSGISDIRNMNLVSIPQEASVNFATTKISYPTITGITVQSSDATGDTITFLSQPTLEARMSIKFSATTIGGLSTGTIYWLGPISGSTTCQLFTDQALTVLVNITSNSTGTAATLNMTALTNWAYDNVADNYYTVDDSGYVWGNNKITTTNSYWTFVGNITVTNAHGNGLGIFQSTTTSGTLFLFVFRNGLIDYTPITNIAWVYGWNPADGSTGNTSTVLNTPLGTNNSHFALVGQDSVFYYTDSRYLGSFFEKSGQTFSPTNTATYTFAQKALTLPVYETAQCLAELGISLLVGGIRNAIYPWNRSATSFTYPILIAENVISKLVTVNTNTYIFAGNRGRIYITNGTNASLYKKIPDHLSGTVEPYYTWKGVGYLKNQLYFGFSVTTNAGVAISTYAGLWAIDLDTKAIRLTNQLSYATYAGYASVIIPILTGNPAGGGFYIGWFDGVSTYGLDSTTSNPYTNYQSYIDYDNVPIGTFLKPKTFENVQWKLSKPLVSGEGVKVSYRKDFSQSFTLIWENTTVGAFSDAHAADFENAQWVQLRVETKSTGTTPSYTRLTELRII